MATSMFHSFPSLTLAADLIPEYTDSKGKKRKWEVVEDVTPTLFNIRDLKFKGFLKSGESLVNGSTMRERAVAMKGNLGLVDAKRLLDHQSEIPTKLRGRHIMFLGTVLRGSGGFLGVPCLFLDGDRWCLIFGWLDGGWDRSFRFACCEPA